MSTRRATKLVTVLGALVVAKGIFGLASPARMSSIAEDIITPAALYGVAAMRLAVGAFLLWIGPACRPDKHWVGLAVRAIGVLAILVAIGIVVMGPAQLQDFVTGSSNHLSLVRGAMLPVLVVGAFLIYAGL
jgi:hypothetical protein